MENGIAPFAAFCSNRQENTPVCGRLPNHSANDVPGKNEVGCHIYLTEFYLYFVISLLFS
jgi:hypothetical protein